MMRGAQIPISCTPFLHPVPGWVGCIKSIPWINAPCTPAPQAPPAPRTLFAQRLQQAESNAGRKPTTHMHAPAAGRAAASQPPPVSWRASDANRLDRGQGRDYVHEMRLSDGTRQRNERKGEGV
jgi:hypothetical protein